jgi:peptide/nickel transport system permease protein
VRASLRYLFFRLVAATISLGLVTVLTFALIHLAPGDPTTIFFSESSGTPEVREQLRRQLGLDQPVYVQYLRWARRTVSGDLGHSFLGPPVADMVGRRLGATLELQACALALAILVSVPLGIVSALKRASALDHLVTSSTFVGISMPEFWFAMVLQLLLAVQLELLPTSTMGSGLSVLERLPYFIMPAIVLAIRRLAAFTRFMRASVLEVLDQPYIVVGRSKGLPERVVILKHAVRNALVPVVTALGLAVPASIGGSVIVEYVFAWPGLGSLAVEAVLRQDYPVIMATTLVMGGIVVGVNLLVDLAYLLVDPRVSYT